MKETVTNEEFDELANARTKKAAKNTAAKHAATSEEEKQSMVVTDEEFDKIWLRDFRLEAIHNLRLGLVTKEDLATQRRYHEELIEENRKEARFYAGLEDRMEEGKKVEECLTGLEIHKIAEDVGYLDEECDGTDQD